jgi:hypothetical protein
MSLSACSHCRALINIGREPRIGQRFLCFFCGTRLSITKVNPPQLDRTLASEYDLDRRAFRRPLS